MMASVSEVPSASAVSQGTTSIRVVGTGTWVGDDARNLLQDLVARGINSGISESVAPGDAAPTPGSSGVMGPGVYGLYLLGSPNSLPPPNN
jgi:hypothetical protein